MRVALLGIAVDSGNRGVMALGAALASLCMANGADEVVVLSGAKRRTPLRLRFRGNSQDLSTETYRIGLADGYRCSLGWILLMALCWRLLPLKFMRARIEYETPWIGMLASCDVVGDVRGGDSFSDIYGMKRFVIGFLVAWTAILVKGRIVQFPQTYGPYSRRSARWLARNLLRRSSRVVARDTKSQFVAQQLVGKSQEVELSPDVAFALEAIVPEEISLAPAGPMPAAGPIGVNVNGLMFNGGYDRNNMFGLTLDYRVYLVRLIHGLLEASERELWLVPHTFAPEGDVESDNHACRLLRDELPDDLRQRVRVVDGDYDQHEIKGVIGQCDFFIGSRMHSCIAALSQGVPCVGTAYSMKFSGVFESVGMGDWVVDARELDTDQAVEATMRCFRKREGRRDGLARESRAARERLHEVFAELVGDSAVSAGTEQQVPASRTA